MGKAQLCKKLEKEGNRLNSAIGMELQELQQGVEQETTPSRQEIERAIDEIIKRFGSAQQATSIVDELHKKHILNSHHNPQKPESYQLPVQTSKQSIKVANPSQFHFSKHELAHIFQFQKRVAAQKFVRSGYGLDLYREEIQKIGLFEIVENRYRLMSREIVIQAFRTLEDFLVQNCGVIVSPLSKLEETCLCSILLNCRYLFDQREILAFMKFVALIFEDGCSSIVMNNQDALSFYRNACGLLKSKLEEGRKVFKLRYEARPQKSQQFCGK